MIRKYHNHIPQTNPLHREEESPFLIQRKEENGHINYFMINLQESMGLGWDHTI